MKKGKPFSARKNDKKNSSRKKEAKDKDNENEIEAKLSNRSGGRFKGGGMPGRGQGQDSFRNGLVYAKQLTELPDYSN